MAVRDLAKEFSWRRTIHRHARSGKSVRAFCQAEGVSEPSFHYWRQVLRARDQSAATSTKNGELLDKHAPRGSKPPRRLAGARRSTSGRNTVVHAASRRGGRARGPAI